MDRRNFLKYLSGTPLLTLPVTALTKPVEEKMKDVDINGMTHLSNCNVVVHGDFTLNGDHQTIHSCHFEMSKADSAIRIENTNTMRFPDQKHADISIKQEFDPFGLAPLKTEGTPTWYDRHRKTRFK